MPVIPSKSDMDRIESGIHRGIDVLTEAINKDDFDKSGFIGKLMKVIVYRIEVPENTDLNRYFEIMNTRGEQLEQHDKQQRVRRNFSRLQRSLVSI